MTAPLRITITGVSGRMGQQLVQAVAENTATVLVGATERPGHPWLGRDLGECLDGPALGVMVTDDPVEPIAGSDAVLDFTAPKPTLEHASLAAQAGAAIVIGTTGFEGAERGQVGVLDRKSVV